MPRATTPAGYRSTTNLGDRLCWHESTVRPETRITLELGAGGPFWVRIRTAGAVTYQEHFETEGAGYGHFEEIVERHTKGESLRARDVQFLS